MTFKFFVNTDINFGIQSSSKIPEALKKENWKRVGVLVDHNIYDLPIIQRLLSLISQNVEFMIAEKVSVAEPTYTYLEEIRGPFSDSNLDAIVGVGGGSVLDVSKAVAVLISNLEPAIYYRGFGRMTEPVLPVIAVPTTAGTGSEITPNASFIDTDEKRKLGINGEAIRPKYAILDPEITLSCPKAPTISAGIDSMVHATEAFIAKKSNPMAKMFAKEGFSLVFENLPSLVDDLENIDLREKVMYGAFLSAIALMNSGTGPAAAMSYPLGVHFGVPHGIGGGIFLPHIIQYNIDAGFFDYAELYQVSDMGQSKQKLAKAFIERVWKTWKKLNIPQDLAEFGMNRSHVAKFVADTMDLKGALDQNPISFYENEIRNTLESLLSSKYD